MSFPSPGVFYVLCAETLVPYDEQGATGKVLRGEKQVSMLRSEDETEYLRDCFLRSNSAADIDSACLAMSCERSTFGFSYGDAPTSQSFYFVFTRRNFTFQVNNEFLKAFLLLLCKCNVRSTYFRALENNEQDIKFDWLSAVRTVFRNLRSASSFLRWASPTSAHVLEHTPGASSDPSQHSGSSARLDCGSLGPHGVLTTKTILHT